MAAATLLATLTLHLAVQKREMTTGIAWMKPGQLSRRLRPSPFTRLKYLILRLPGAWQLYMSGREHILIESRLVTLASETAQQNAPLARCWTNAEGTRAWVLSARELKSINQQIKSLPGLSVDYRARVTTYDGGQCQFMTGPSSPAAGTVSTPVGLTVDLLPNVSGKSFHLLAGATFTEIDASPDGSSRARTNLAAAFQAVLPNGGGLVLESKAANNSPKTYWFILSSVAIDARGKPKSL